MSTLVCIPHTNNEMIFKIPQGLKRLLNTVKEGFRTRNVGKLYSRSRPHPFVPEPRIRLDLFPIFPPL